MESMVKKDSQFNVILETSGNKHEGKGETLDDAFADIPLTWNQIKSKGIFTITHGKKKIEKLFYLRQLRRIFANRLTRQLWARNLERLLDNGTAQMNSGDNL